MPTTENSQTLSFRQRRYDLDWLRVLAVLLLIYFHSSAIFYRGDLGDYYIRNAQPSRILSGFLVFVHQWHMPLFFLISGAGTGFALSFRSPQQYLQERCQRLLIPFVFGILVLVPPNVYLQLLIGPNYHDSYFQFYPHFFNGIRPNGNFEWAHLWFIAYLFTFSLISLPLLLSLRKPDFWLRSTLADWVEKPGVILLMALPLAAIEGALRPRWAGFQNLYSDWANFCLYLLYFIYGYLIYSDERFENAIDRHRVAATGLAIVCMSILLSLWSAGRIPDRAYSLSYILYQCFRGCNTWLWVLALLGWARKGLNFNSELLQYANEAAYPVFLLHQPVLATIGFYVVRLDLSIMAKFLLIGTAALLVTIALYELLIRRFNVPRLLFGLKPIAPQAISSTQPEIGQPNG